MEWLSVFLGAIIGFISSVGIIFIERMIDRSGKIKIYMKIVYEHQSGKYTWGFQNASDGLYLNVPLWIEIQNLSNIGRVVRDVNLVLFREGYKVAEMKQINRSGNSENRIVYANNGSYSFSLSPRTASQYTCHFALKMNMQNPQYFDQIRLRYFDERGKEHFLSIGYVNGNWKPGDFERLESWNELDDNSVEKYTRSFLMNEGKIEYLQMIQEPIGRMSTSSAIFKGFAATIVAGISALTYCQVNTWVLGLSFIPVLLFFFLDIYYLKLEKKYRHLYEQVRLDNHPVDFSMQLSKDNKAAKSRLSDCLRSPSIWLFYPAMILILLTVFVLKVTGGI